MSRKYYLCLFFVITFLTIPPVFAENNIYKDIDPNAPAKHIAKMTELVRSNMKPEWLTCQEAEDCHMIAFNCEGRIAVNSKYVEEANEMVCRVASCTWRECSPLHQLTAVCEKNQCGVEVWDGVPVLDHCYKDSDCAMVVYNCNQAKAFNIYKRAEGEDQLCASEYCSMGGCEEFRHYQHSAQCQKHHCVAQHTPLDKLDPGNKKWNKKFGKDKSSVPQKPTISQ